MSIFETAARLEAGEGIVVQLRIQGRLYVARALGAWARLAVNGCVVSTALYGVEA